MKSKLYVVLLMIICPMALWAQIISTPNYDSPELFQFKHNSDKAEFGGNVAGDTLYYYKLEKSPDKKKRAKRNEEFFHVYSVLIDKNGQSQDVPKYDSQKSTKHHDGPICYSKALNCFFISNSEYDGAIIDRKVFRKRMVQLKIDIVDAKTKKVTPFPHNNLAYSVTHPAINNAGDVLYFSSDMPGGHGGKDLYKSVFKNGEWQKPENLGEPINTSADEMFPFIGIKNEFFFASNREGGKGGLDIYTSQLSGENHFSEPVSMKAPFNSDADDFAFYMADGRHYAFFASNREDEFNDEIYNVKLAPWHKDIDGKAIDGGTGEALADVQVKLFDQNNELLLETISNQDGSFEFEIEQGVNYVLSAQKQLYGDAKEKVDYDTKNVLMKLHGGYIVDLVVIDAENNQPVPGVSVRNLTDGKVWNADGYLAKVSLAANADNQLRVEAEGYLMQRVAFNTAGLTYGSMSDTVMLYSRDRDKLFQLSNINYDYGKASLREESKRELDKLVSLMKENPSVMVTLRSHTDSRGSDEFNLYLSDKRSESCKQYLIDHGVSISRISARGYGETQLLNECANGVECEEEMHFANRRTEIKFSYYVSETDKQAAIETEIKATGNRYFILANSFKNEYLADHFYEDMQFKGVKVMKMGRIRGGFYAVAIESYSSLQEALKRVEEVKKQEGFEDAWVYDYGRY
ncbi:MAG: OmpA family protein [Mangrovibacterium sp.]